MGADARVSLNDLARARAVLASVDSSSAQEFDFIAELDAAGAALHAHGFYSEAESAYRKVLDLRIAHSVGDSTYLDTLHRLCVLYRLQQNFAEAEKIHLQANAYVKAMYGANNLRVADQNNYLAGIYYAWGRFEDAAKVTLETLAAYESTLGSDSLPAGLCHFALALIYHQAGNLDKSHKHFLAANDIVTRQVYSTEETIEEGLLSMAITHFRQNDFIGAETLFRHSIILREEKFWPFHPLVPQTLLKLGQMYEVRGRHAKAELCYEKALRKQQDVFGAAHPMLVDTLAKLANFHSQYGDGEKAKVFGQQISDLRE